MGKAKDPRASMFIQRKKLNQNTNPNANQQVKKPNGTSNNVSGNGKGKTTPTSSNSKESTPVPTPSDLDPPGSYIDFRICTPPADVLERQRNYVAFRFDSRKKQVDLPSWNKPVKLNRKEPTRKEDDVFVPDVKLTPMLGLDGRPVVGADGHFVMVGPDGRPALQHARKPLEKPAESNGKGKRKPFQRKTKQIFQIDEGTRKLRKEERYPWVLEDRGGKEIWVSQLEEISKRDTHAFFVPNMSGQEFFFVPSHRWYKMVKRPSWKTMGLEEAEEELARFSKSKNPQFWLMHNKGKQMSASTAATLSDAGPSSMANVSLGPGGRRLKLVDSGQKSRFEQDDEFGEGGGRRAKNEEDGDIDEVEVDFDDFADDDDAGGMDAIDEDEAKELEERMKREYASVDRNRANQGRNEVDEDDLFGDDDDVDMKELTDAGRGMKKIVKKLDKGAGGDDSDKEDNPYASDVESDEEEATPEVVATGVMQNGQVDRSARKALPLPVPIPNAAPSGSAAPSPPPTQGTVSAPSPPALSRTGTGTRPPSRATSPVPPGAGSSLVAKRATSPKAPNRDRGPTSPTGSRATSPLASSALGPGSRAASPGASRVGSRAGSPELAGYAGVGGKRKADDDGNTSPTSPTSPGLAGVSSPSTKAHGTGPPTTKKPRLSTPNPSSSQLAANQQHLPPFTEQMIVSWLQRTPNATSKDCIAEFKKYLRKEGEKERFTAVMSRVAKVRKGILVLKSEAERAASATNAIKKVGSEPGTPVSPS